VKNPSLTLRYAQGFGSGRRLVVGPPTRSNHEILRPSAEELGMTGDARRFTPQVKVPKLNRYSGAQ